MGSDPFVQSASEPFDLDAVIRPGNTLEMGASVTKTVKLPRPIAAALARTAKARGCTESALIREGIEKVTGEDAGLDMQALIGSDLGIGRGPHDLSTNRKHLSKYGRPRNR